MAPAPVSTTLSPAAGGPATDVVDKRQRLLDAALRRHQYRQDALIEVLHTAQNLYGYLTTDLLWFIAEQLHLPPSRVYGVATFYNFFSLKPPGEHACVVCEGTVCYIRGAAKITAALTEAFGVEPGATTADGTLSVAIARCLGSCGLAPVLVVDGEVVGRATPEETVEHLRGLTGGVNGLAAAPAERASAR